MRECFGNVYAGKKVFLTGHSGFKGSWLKLWLEKLGADVKGYSLLPPTKPSHINELYPNEELNNEDIRNLKGLLGSVKEFSPDIIFHLAAQPLVRYSYDNPVETYETNVMGSVNLLEAVRNVSSVKAVVIVSSDKCYENKEWEWGYRENEPMGGYDPYSSSKGCTEILTSSFRNSFFNLNDYGKNHDVLVASVRAGNVIGGGDWAHDRLIPDIVKATSRGEEVEIRSPNATRPWQHVLEPLSGYLLVGQKLLEGDKSAAEGWNFGPLDEGTLTVGNVLEKMSGEWDSIKFKLNEENKVHEANLLNLDCSKALHRLNWESVWRSDMTIRMTCEWYKEFYEKNEIISKAQLERYINDAFEKKIVWVR